MTTSAVISSVGLVSILWAILIIYFIASFIGIEIFYDLKSLIMVILFIIIILISTLS
jgi:hypothetical protein